MDYHKLYDDLVQYANSNGIKVQLKEVDVLYDYAGMNSETAKKFGFPMPDRCIYIKQSDPIETKYHTLNHECMEIGLVKKGDSYWEAHVKSLKRERETSRLPNLSMFKGTAKRRRKATVRQVSK